MNKTIRGALLILLGLVLIAAASLIWVLQDQEDQMAGQSAAILLNELEQELERPVFVPPETSAPAPETTGLPDPEPTPAPMPETTYSGYSMIGRLSIPAIGVQLPILSSWNDNLLKVAPCRYSGTAESGDLILLGHNYRAHFKNLARLTPGDQVEFTAADGTVYRYTVDAVDTIRGTDVDKLAGDHELTVFTCTLDRIHRTVVRCRLNTP